MMYQSTQEPLSQEPRQLLSLIREPIPRTVGTMGHGSPLQLEQVQGKCDESGLMLVPPEQRRYTVQLIKLRLTQCQTRLKAWTSPPFLPAIPFLACIVRSMW